MRWASPGRRPTRSSSWTAATSSRRAARPRCWATRSTRGPSPSWPGSRDGQPADPPARTGQAGVVAPEMSLLVLSEAEIRSVLSPRAAIDSQRAAYLAAADGTVTASGVTSSLDPADDSLAFAHTGAIRGLTGVTCKFGLQVPGNAARGLPTVHAVVTVLRPGTGEPLACLNGAAVTALRTAAGIGAAAEVLARPDASRLGLVGAGVQAREAARMIGAVRALSQIRVLARSAQRGTEVAADLEAAVGVAGA